MENSSVGAGLVQNIASPSLFWARENDGTNKQTAFPLSSGDGTDTTIFVVFIFSQHGLIEKSRLV